MQVLNVVFFKNYRSIEIIKLINVSVQYRGPSMPITHKHISPVQIDLLIYVSDKDLYWSHWIFAILRRRSTYIQKKSRKRMSSTKSTNIHILMLARYYF